MRASRIAIAIAALSVLATACDRTPTGGPATPPTARFEGDPPPPKPDSTSDGGGGVKGGGG